MSFSMLPTKTASKTPTTIYVFIILTHNNLIKLKMKRLATVYGTVTNNFLSIQNYL